MMKSKISKFRDDYHDIEILHIFNGSDVDSSDECLALTAAPARDPYILILPHFKEQGGFLVVDKEGIKKIVEFLNKVIAGDN